MTITELAIKKIYQSCQNYDIEDICQSKSGKHKKQS